MRIAAACAIGFLIVFNVALISLEVGSVPVRAFLATAMLGALALALPDLLIRSVIRHARLMVLATVLAALGIFVSLVNGVAPATIGRMVLEVHVQAVVTLLLATMLAELAGARAAVVAFCSAIGLTAIVALFQYVGIDAAWELRKTLGDLQGHELADDSSFLNRRPMGLSYSPIHLSTQACLAFGAFAALRLWGEQQAGSAKDIDWVMLAALALMVWVSYLSQTRSPIVGAAVFVGLYLLWRGSAFHRLLLAVAVVCLAVAAPMILDLMQGAESRIFRIGDNSSSGRFTLVTYGWLLLADNPLGYGFGFVPQDHWGRYWQDIYTMPSAGEVREAELHNYALNMMTTYGIGLLLVVPLVAQLIWSGRAYLIAFVPYLAHMVFHNTGPFWNDTLFWFVIGAIAALHSGNALLPKSERRLTRRRPRRSLRTGTA